MALKCFLQLFQNVWPSDNHNYGLHSVVSHTQGCYLQNQQVADSFLLCESVSGMLVGDCEVYRNVCICLLKTAETFRQL